MAELPEYKVTIEPMDDETRRFIKDDYPEHLGLRTKLGGKPSAWSLEEADVRCDECKQEMNFVGQIDPSTTIQITIQMP